MREKTYNRSDCLIGVCFFVGETLDSKTPVVIFIISNVS